MANQSRCHQDFLAYDLRYAPGTAPKRGPALRAMTHMLIAAPPVGG